MGQTSIDPSNEMDVDSKDVRATRNRQRNHIGLTMVPTQCRRGTSLGHVCVKSWNTVSSCQAERRDEVKEYVIDVRWDAAASVWVATSDTVAGVAVEAANCEGVLGSIEDVLSDLFCANGLAHGKGTVSVVFDTRLETIRMAPA